MSLKATALVLVGYQNDYFAKDAILHALKAFGVMRGDQILAVAQTPAAV
jgi:nicotinamidase-related amidase